MTNLAFIEGSKQFSGVPGSEVAAKIGTTDAPVFYVNPTSAGATVASEGLSPGNAATLLQTVIDSGLLKRYSTIYVSGALTEAIVVTTTTLPDDVTIIGTGFTSIAPATAAGLTLALGKRWNFENITFLLGTATGISLQLTASIDASKSTFTNCVFDGQDDCLLGVDFNGAPSDVKFTGCKFVRINEAGNGGTAMDSSSVATDESDGVIIDGCEYYDNDGHIDLPLNVSTITRSVFNTLGNVDVTAATGVIDLRGGTVGHNIVTRNLLGGDYSNTGGYYDGAGGAGDWTGNFSADTAETEVGDNAITLLPPAA